MQLKFGNLTRFEIYRALTKLGGEAGVREFIQDYSDVQPDLSQLQLDRIMVGVEDPARSRRPFTILPDAAAYFKERRYSEAATPQGECVVYKGSLRALGFEKICLGSAIRIWEVQNTFFHLGFRPLSLELLGRLRAAYHYQPVGEFINVPVCDFDAIMLLGHGKGSGLTIDRKPFNGYSFAKLDSEWFFTC